MTKRTKIITNSLNVVQLLNDDEAMGEFGEAIASVVAQNPAVVWAKFILTDDLVNANGQRIPHTEFANLIKTGVHMPFKMAEGEIEDHFDSKPLGTITNLVESIDDINNTRTIKALAALWCKERPADVEFIKGKVSSGEGVGVSWEILYNDFDIEEGGIMALKDVALAAVTAVRNPAYQGRTPIMVVASAGKWSRAYLDQLPDTSFLYIEDGGILDESGKTYPRQIRHFPILDSDGSLDKDRLLAVNAEIDMSPLPDELKDLVRRAVDTISRRLGKDNYLDEIKLIMSSLNITEEELDELEKIKQDKADLETALEELKGLKADAEAKLSEAESALKEASDELATLREFKAEFDAKNEREARLADIKQKFVDNGLEKEETFFEEYAENLLSLDEKALEFMIQELVAFSKNELPGNESASTKGKLPNFVIPGNTDEEISISDLAKELKSLKAK